MHNVINDILCCSLPYYVNNGKIADTVKTSRAFKHACIVTMAPDEREEQR